MEFIDVSFIQSISKKSQNLKKYSTYSEIPIKSVTATQSFTNFLATNGHADLSAAAAIDFYKRVAPLYTAIDIIASEVKSITPIILDKKSKTVVESHPLLSLIKNPNMDATWQEFIERIVTFERVTGNAFIVATGNVRREPREVFVVPSQNISIENGQDGFTQTIDITNVSGVSEFDRELVNGEVRFVSREAREIYHIRTLNPNPLGSLNLGMSPLNPIFFEIEQYVHSSVHNLSLLKRGARMSAVFSFEDQLTDDQRERMKEQLHAFYGSDNAGKAIITEQKMNIKEMSSSNRDMDFYDLKKDVTAAIYSSLRIPLSLITTENQTFSNYETGQQVLYDNAILPLAKKVYEELTNFLMPRYPRSEDLILTFDINDIPALETRRAQKLKARKELNIYTPNEMRAYDLAEPLSVGGDRLYQPGNYVPFAVDSETDNIDQETSGIEGVDDNTKASQFIKRLQKRTTNGIRTFTDEQINRIARKNGIL